MKIVILAGGSGERFWPLSTPETPKQFLKLFGDKTLLRQTFERLLFKSKPENIYIVTNQKYADMTYNEVPEIPKENVLLEPLKKNTAPACVLASVNIDPEEIIFIVPADHYITNIEKFWDTVSKAAEFLKSNQEGIITFGIVPTRAETGYGYIEYESKVDENIFTVKKFHEKPSLEVAKEYVNSGRFFWNSGMFMYRNDYFVSQMKKHAPGVIKPFYQKKNLNEIYESVPSISIDYALMEKADRIYMVRAEFEWSDVGNWSSLCEFEMENSNPSVLLNSSGLVKTTKSTIVLGLKDVIVIETEMGLLVANKEKLHLLREAIQLLKFQEQTH